MEQQFKMTMPNSTFVKLERIQNKRLWKTYKTELENLSEKHNIPVDKVETKFLYHGTRLSNPNMIYNGEEGFDMNFSSSGMWGIALYFAVNASYSNGYAFNVPQGGLKQMFIANVIVGKAKELASDPKLRMPPLIEGKDNVRYDSVQGSTGGSTVYMVYANKKAYPQYLITYT